MNQDVIKIKSRMEMHLLVLKDFETQKQPPVAREELKSTIEKLDDVDYSVSDILSGLGAEELACLEKISADDYSIRAAFIPRKEKEDLVWKERHSDFKSDAEGHRSIMLPMALAKEHGPIAALHRLPGKALNSLYADAYDSFTRQKSRAIFKSALENVQLQYGEGLYNQWGSSRKDIADCLYYLEKEGDIEAETKNKLVSEMDRLFDRFESSQRITAQAPEIAKEHTARSLQMTIFSSLISSLIYGLDNDIETRKDIETLQRKAKLLKRFGGKMEVRGRGALFITFETKEGEVAYQHHIRQQFKDRTHSKKVST